MLNPKKYYGHLVLSACAFERTKTFEDTLLELITKKIQVFPKLFLGLGGNYQLWEWVEVKKTAMIIQEVPTGPLIQTPISNQIQRELALAPMQKLIKKQVEFQRELPVYIPEQFCEENASRGTTNRFVIDEEIANYERDLLAEIKYYESIDPENPGLF